MAHDTSHDSVKQKDRTEILERRLKRERHSREQAEQLLREKTQSLYETLKESQAVQKDLELALWASQESFWSWKANTDIMEIRSFSLHSENELTWSGTLIHMMERVHEDDLDGLQFHWTMALHGNRDRIEFSFRLKLEREYQWVRLRGRVLKRGQNGEALHIVGTTKDITSQRKAEQSFHLMASAFASSREPMLVLSPELVITECNDAFIQLMGASVKEQYIGMDFNRIFISEKVNRELLAVNKQLRFESSIKAKGEQVKSVDISIALFETYQQTSSYLIATMRDITDRKRNEAKLRQLALSDELTGLSNRNALREFISTLVKEKQQFVLAFIDLDGFKAINDTAGHDQGDIELKRVGTLLTDMFDKTGNVGRWGETSLSQCCLAKQLKTRQTNLRSLFKKLKRTSYEQNLHSLGYQPV